VNCKTTANISGIAYNIRHVVLAAGSAELEENIAYSRTKGEVKDRATRGEEVQIFGDNDRADRAGDRDCSTNELKTTVSQCV
jgi:hypothetical protein